MWMSPALMVLSSLASASAATDPEKWWVRCGGPFNLCGYVERVSEEGRLPKRFEVAKPFSDGMAAVRIDGRYGYIDTSGRIVIEPRYEAAGPFTGNYAEVRVDGLSGAIDRSGRLVVPAQFSRMVPFADGSFIAKPLPPGETRSPMSPRLGGEIHLEGLADALVGLGGGIYHLKKGWMTPSDLSFSQFDKPARGLIWAGRRNDHQDEQWGLMKADGSWQVTPRYNHVQRLMETHAVVGSMPDYSLPPIERRKALRRGAVDRDGKLVVPLEFTGLSYWRGGYGYATGPKLPSSEGPPTTMERGIVLPAGALLAGRYFDEVDIREDGTLPRGRVGDIWYSIDPDGRLLPDQLDGSPLVRCPGGLTIVRRGAMVEVQRPGDGKSVALFDDTYLTERECPGPFSLRRNGKWFVVMEDGKVLGGPTGFGNIYSFSPNYSAVEVVGKWGIIDRAGAFTVKPKFRKLRPAGRDKFVVGEGATLAWIDGKGGWIKAPVVPIRPPKEALTCDGGLRFFSAGGLWGLQDGDGQTVIEPRYRALSCFRQGVSWTAAPDSKLWCPVGPKGGRREALDCRLTYYPVTVTHHYPEKFSDDRFESSVLWNIAWLEHAAGRRAAYPKWVPDEYGRGSYSVSPGAATNR